MKETISLYTDFYYEISVVRCYLITANMSVFSNYNGLYIIYNGLQSHISDINKLAIYILCAAHLLKLVAVCATENCIREIFIMTV